MTASIVFSNITEFKAYHNATSNSSVRLEAILNNTVDNYSQVIARNGTGLNATKTSGFFGSDPVDLHGGSEISFTVGAQLVPYACVEVIVIPPDNNKTSTNITLNITTC